MIELFRAATFFACLLSLYWTALSAFFVPNIHWQDRLLELLAKLTLSATLCLLSALVFRIPIRTHSDAPPDARPSLINTLPLQLFFWAAPLLLLLYLASWYLTCGAPTFTSHYPACT